MNAKTSMIASTFIFFLLFENVLYHVCIILFISVNFEHGNVDPDAFTNFKANFQIGMPEPEAFKENREKFKGPQLKLSVKANHLTYTSTSKTLRHTKSRLDIF